MPGDISIITQSGGVGITFLNLLASESLGLNKFVSAGNMLDIGTEELLEYLIEDEGTRIICLYLEGIQDGRRLMEVARRSGKPILALKANIGRLGKNIASSHTASLSSDDRVVDATFRQCGIARVHEATALGAYLKVLKLPPCEATTWPSYPAPAGTPSWPPTPASCSVSTCRSFPGSSSRTSNGTSGPRSSS